ncbi:MAG: HAMP domain-containing protein [Alphaproteobacteria bacterium TMED89]|nr:histidine kinase [Rhodospirillaceae bacterium]RPH16125.1 MAG: HAMP domain-containing protein [Alphaproteobacteria bacterium TMED89]
MSKKPRRPRYSGAGLTALVLGRRIRWRPRGPGSRSLVGRILAINMITLLIPVIGFLYTDRYRQFLIDGELEALRSEGRIIAVALGSAAVTGEASDKRLDEDRSALFLRLLTIDSPSRARLFALNGDLLADSRALRGGTTPIYAQSLDEPTLFESLSPRSIWRAIRRGGRQFPRYIETMPQRADHYPEAAEALFGKFANGVRGADGNALVLSAAVPVQEYRRVLGGLMISRETTVVDDRIASMQTLILSLFLIALVITVMLSIYLANTIAQPVRALAKSADLVRRQKDRRHAIPDLSERGDEIGDLSLSLRDMTESLWDRIDSMESFAADIAHELKNPLTSLRSAFETLSMVQDPSQQEVLLDILTHDVDRMDRLISDISDSSRLDAELARSHWEEMDLYELAQDVVSLQRQMAETDVEIILEPSEPRRAGFPILGAELRLGQVLVNLITNAQTFSPEGGKIWVRLSRARGDILLTVEDQGVGFPADKLTKVFDRFYTDRPEQDGFGKHSGLGLSISKQIVNAHGGKIWAENADRGGEISGARVVLRLPEMPADFQL